MKKRIVGLLLSILASYAGLALIWNRCGLYAAILSLIPCTTACIAAGFLLDTSDHAEDKPHE